MNMQIKDRLKYRVFYNGEYVSAKDQDLVMIDCDGIAWETSCHEINGLLSDRKNTGVIIEQCTGLKDKNGKLIYDGDICISYCGDVGVIFQHPSGAYMIKGKTKKGMEFDYNIYWHHYEYEIIGNIHNNNELLEKE